MDIERNKQTARRVFDEAFNAGRLDVIDECLAADGVDHHDLRPAAGTDDFRAHLKSVISMFRASFPDLCMTVRDIVGEGDRVAMRVLMTGTHRGAPFMGIPPSGATFAVEQFHFVQCNEAGQGIAHWAAVGEDALLRQLQPA